MKVVRTEIPDVVILEPQLHQDHRGFFLEGYNRRSFRDAIGLDIEFVQDNLVFSVRNVLRGLHYQARHAQGKLVYAAAGEIFDVSVDLRRASPTFGKSVGVTLTGGGHRMIWIPPGFAHGYLALSEHAIVFYKATDYYAPQHERTIRWNDPDLAIRWPLEAEPILSNKDRAAGSFRSAELFD